MTREETAQIVAQVVPPVSSAMPDPQVRDMDTLPAGAEPETTLGPGQLARGMDMLELFTETEDERQEWDQHEEDDAEQAAWFHRLFRHDTEPVDEGDFDNESELRIITALTWQHPNMLVWASDRQSA